MSLKTYKPYTKSTRTTILVDRKNIWKGSPIKSLTTKIILVSGMSLISIFWGASYQYYGSC